MNIFNFIKQNKELIRLLRSSQQEFKFDKQKVKNNLLSEIQEQQLNTTADRVKNWSGSGTLNRHRFALGLAVALVFVTGIGATLTQANSSKPGDRLYFLDTWQEKTLLKLPLLGDQKAKIQANIVEERNQELSELLENDNHADLKIETVRQVQLELSKTVDDVKKIQSEYSKNGKKQKADNLDTVLDQLENIAGEQETKIEDLRKNQYDELKKDALDHDLEEVRKTKIRIRNFSSEQEDSSGPNKSED